MPVSTLYSNFTLFKFVPLGVVQSTCNGVPTLSTLATSPSTSKGEENANSPVKWKIPDSAYASASLSASVIFTFTIFETE